MKIIAVILNAQNGYKAITEFVYLTSKKVNDSCGTYLHYKGIIIHERMIDYLIDVI